MEYLSVAALEYSNSLILKLFKQKVMLTITEPAN